MLVGTPKSKSPIHKVKGYGENRVCKSDHKAEPYYKKQQLNRERVSSTIHLIVLEKNMLGPKGKARQGDFRRK